MATGSTDIHRLSPEEMHGLYNGHSPEALAEVERVLAAPGSAPALILSGEPGCGRTGLLEAAAHGAGRQGSPQGSRISVLPLDLDGYEEGLDLTRFTEVQIARRWELEPTAREALRERTLPLLPFIPSSLAGAALVSLLLRQDDPAAVWKTLPAAATDARPALSGLLDRLGREARVIVHTLDSAQLNDPLRRWLLDESRRNPAVVLAFSCAAGDPDAWVAPRAERLRLELHPLPAEGLLEPMQELLEDVELATADRLQRFLDLAALCGENVPAEALFHHLELEEEEREELLDLIDEELVEDENLRLFVDHQYGHPSFPGLLTYAFLSPRLNHVLMEPIPAAKRGRLATELLEFLNRSFPIHSRGMTLLRLNLARYLEDAEARKAFLRELRVWIGENDVEDLAAELSADLAEGLMGPADVLTTARQADGHWPPHTRLAFLEAARSRSGDLSPADRLELSNLRAELLRDLGRQPEALEDARRSLEESLAAYGDEHATTARALNLQGIILRDLKRPQEALVPLENALAMQDRQRRDDPNLASILANLGMVLRDLGQREAAREHLENALAIHRQVFGDAHPTVAADFNNLAALAREMEQPEKAFEYLRPIVDINRRLYGDVHPETSRALTNVAGVLRELGDGEAARSHLEAALQIDRQAFGEAHPQVVADLNNLAVVERELGNADEAREHFEQALALSLQAFGEDHPLTVQLRRATAEG
ncbi:MAG TPA: tetratricopeptide repeat protein [Thermoanaerobaculia bacterium]|nr:tetratricopeptide repeat protein [Thermoanaerobaculia bacterium]